MMVSQYSPHTLTRRLEPLMMGGENKSETLRIKDAPLENIDVVVEM